jgi:hypothetical protein
MADANKLLKSGEESGGLKVTFSYENAGTPKNGVEPRVAIDGVQCGTWNSGLERLISAWPRLSDDVRRKILKLVLLASGRK